MRKIIVAILVMILVFTVTFGTYYLIKNDKKGNENNTPKQVSEGKEEIEEEKIPDDITINMTVTGDVLCHNTNFWDAYDASTDSYDFSYVFEDIEKYFSSADIAVGTIETSFAGKEAGYSNYPTFNSPEELATDLKELGYDVMAMATNHCLDKGYKGLVSTIDELDKAGIKHIGTYKSEEDSKEILIQDVKGIKMAFLNYTYGTNGIPIPAGKEYSVNLIDKDKIKADIEKAKKLNADVICVNMHWGEEYRQTATQEQEELADFLFQNGVDLILGSHTHVLEPMEKRTVTLADGTKKDGFVIYSLGNFMSGQNANYTRQSVILDIQLTKKGKDNTISIDSVKYTPIYMYNIYAGKSMNRFKIMDIEEEIKKYDEGDTTIGAQLYNTLVSELEHIYKVVGNEIE